MQISDASGRIVAADIENAFSSVDLAILDVARLTATIMEAKRATAIAPAQFQPVVDTLSASLLKLAESRKAMATTHRSLMLLKQRSNLAEIDFGCFSIVAGKVMPHVKVRA